MNYKEDEILKRYIETIESNMDGFFKLVHFLTPKWFQFLGYLSIVSVFWYIAKSTGNNLLYVITVISEVLVVTSILGFIDTINHLTFKSKIISQLMGFMLVVLPLFWLSTFTTLTIVDFLTFQFG